MQYQKFALFSDLDGTLFSSDRTVSLGNRSALERFVAGGGLFGIATGRAPRNALTLLPDVPINTWSVVLNGTEAFDYRTNTVALSRSLSQLRMAGFLHEVLDTWPQVNVLVCSESSLYFLSAPAARNRDFFDSHQPCQAATLETVLQYPWLKCLLCAPRPILKQMEEYAVRTGVTETADRVYTAVDYLEFLPKGVHKGRCLEDLRRMGELAGRTIVAVGDWTNDLELLQAADVAVAPANALPEIKALCDYVTVSNNDDAIAAVIDEILPQL